MRILNEADAQTLRSGTLEELKIKHQPVYCHAVPNKCARGG